MSKARKRERHGQSKTKVYGVWEGMLARCTNPNDKAFKNYGGRGIQVCERWRNSFVAFIEDMGPRPEGMWLERIDNDGHYEPANCKWQTPLVQLNNSRHNVNLTLNGVTKNIKQWSQHLGLAINVIQDRRRKGWPVELVLTTKRFKRNDRPQLNVFARTETLSDS